MSGGLGTAERRAAVAPDRPLFAGRTPSPRARHEPGEEEAYFLARMRSSLAEAEASRDAVAKLVHFDLAGRYSVAARKAAPPS
jgi:hypothetical protein